MVSKGKRKHLVILYRWLRFIKLFGEADPELLKDWTNWKVKPTKMGPPTRVNFTIQDLSSVIHTPIDSFPMRVDSLPMHCIFVEKGPTNVPVIC